MLWHSLAAVVVAALVIPALGHAQGKRWPTLAEQLSKDRVIPGSALERLIEENQDFGLLATEELEDGLRIPLWLRVVWRKAHPELEYSVEDPTGGYPLVLKEVHEWMLSHQDLQPGKSELSGDAGQKAATAGVNVNVSGTQSSARSESDIRVNFWDVNKVISASNNIGGSGSQGQYWSTDGGATWGRTELPRITGDAFHSDPTVDWTSDGRAWSTTIGINSTGTQLRMRSYVSTDNGATWSFDATFSGSQTSADKQLMWVDHSATSPYSDNVYTIWHNGTPCYMNRRTASGWGTPIQVSGAESTGTAIGADVKTNANGDVFGFWPTTGNRKVLVVKSTNGGVSYGTPVQIATTYDAFDIGVPSFNNRRILIYVYGAAYRTATKNNVYASWTDLSGDTGCTSAANEPGSNVSSSCKTRIWFSRSTDGGATWSAKTKINNQAGLNDQFNQALALDETNGRLAIIYYDTVDDPGRKKTHVYYQSSDDDGVTWSSPLRVTTAQTDETVSGADLGNQYGDYNGLSGYADTFFPSWTDRRSAGKEQIWTAAVEETGGTCTPPAAPTGLSATTVSSSQINLSWSAVSGASSYRVYRSTTSGGPYALVATVTAPTTSYSNTGLSPSTTYYYVVRAFTSCESANSNQASATTSAGGGCSTSTLYSNGFETGSGLSDWTRGTFVSGGSVTDWRGIQTCSAQTGSKVFRFGGSSCTANYGNSRFIFAVPKGATGISVPAGSSATTLSFGHRRRFENGYDGGTLALSLDGSSYSLVPATAITGATYNDTVDPACPPSGSSGLPFFTGIQTSFVNTTVNLDAVCDAITGGSGGCAGQTLHVAFTTVTDCSTTDDGWFLDNVTLTACTP